MSGKESRYRSGKLLPLFQETFPQAVFPRQLELRSEPRFAPELAPGRRSPVELRSSPDIVVSPPAEEFSVDRMDGGERAPESRVVAVSAQLKVLEHEECLLARLTLAQRDGNSGAGRGKRSEAVSFGSEIIELRAGVCFGEICATAALEQQASVDATSRDRRRALDSERARDI